MSEAGKQTNNVRGCKITMRREDERKTKRMAFGIMSIDRATSAGRKLNEVKRLVPATEPEQIALEEVVQALE
jgi:hypothetical protein